MWIELAGALASGKSTLSADFRREGFHVVSEDLSTNPYLDLVRQAPERYAFPCQQRFIDDKIDSIFRAFRQGHENIVADFCLTVERAYVTHYLESCPEQARRLCCYIDRFYESVGKPDAIVFLKCAPETILDRIRQRGRVFEQGHDFSFVRKICGLVEENVAAAAASGIRVIELDSGAVPSAELWAGKATEIVEMITHYSAPAAA